MSKMLHTKGAKLGYPTGEDLFKRLKEFTEDHGTEVWVELPYGEEGECLTIDFEKESNWWNIGHSVIKNDKLVTVEYWPSIDDRSVILTSRSTEEYTGFSEEPSPDLGTALGGLGIARVIGLLKDADLVLRNPVN